MNYAMHVYLNMKVKDLDVKVKVKDLDILAGSVNQ